MAAILYSIFAFDGATPFPSLYALIPTVGTVLIILFALNGTFVHTLLSLRYVVGVGIVSYSLYLWHQPVFAFYRYQAFPSVSNIEYFMLMGLTVILSVFTYFCVERLRYLKASLVIVLSASAFFSAAFAAFGLAAHLTGGYKSQLVEHGSIFLEMEFYRKNYWTDYTRFINTYGSMVNSFPNNENERNVLVIDNSWAFDIAYSLASQESFNIAFEEMTGHQCSEFTLPNLPQFDNEYGRWLERCTENFDKFKNIPENTDIVVLADNLFESGQYDDDLIKSAFINNLSQIRESFDGEVIIIKGRPTWDLGGGYSIAYRVDEISSDQNIHLQGLLSRPLLELDEAHKYYQDFYSQYDVTFTSLLSPLCPQDLTLGKRVCTIFGNNEVYYFDGGHLTIEGGGVI